MSNPNDISPIASAVEKFLIPWFVEHGSSTLFFARGTHKEAVQKSLRLPPGAFLEPRQWKHKEGRHSYRLRPYSSSTVVHMQWKADGLLAARTPKLCFVLSGHVAFTIADYILHCKTGQAILLPPGVPFPNGYSSYIDTAVPGNKQCELLQILPHPGGQTICWTTRHWEKDGLFYKSSVTSAILQSSLALYLDLLMGEYEVEDEYQEPIQTRILQTLLMRLLRELRHLPTLRTGSDFVPEAPGLMPLQTHPILQAQEYIRSKIAQPLTIEQVAQRFCMSRSMFTSQFREKTGKSFVEYVNDCRFEQAQMLLSETNLSIEQIGKAVGVSSAYVRALFRERMNISPMKFRKQCRESKEQL